MKKMMKIKRICSNWGGPKWYWNTKYGILDQKGLIEKWQETRDTDLYKLICEMNKEDKEKIIMTNLPVSGMFRVTCEFGRKNTNKLKWAAGFHTGIDIVSDNRKVYSTCTGNVFQCGYDNAYGNFIVIRDFDTDNFHWFCHLNKILITQGQRVTKTTCIGIMGATGNVTGLHLHFEIRKQCNCYGKVLNPADYMGIPNKVGIYNSDNYKIDNFKKGDIIYTKCLFTGAENSQQNSSLIQKHDKQFWVYNSSLNKEKNIMRIVICYIEGDELLVECDSVTDENKQFWINKNEVVK